VDVIIGEPIETHEYTDKRVHELMARTRKAIEANLEAENRRHATAEVSV
jgi:hypothetical protein